MPKGRNCVLALIVKNNLLHINTRLNVVNVKMVTTYTKERIMKEEVFTVNVDAAMVMGHTHTLKREDVNRVMMTMNILGIMMIINCALEAFLNSFSSPNEMNKHKLSVAICFIAQCCAAAKCRMCVEQLTFGVSLGVAACARACWFVSAAARHLVCSQMAHNVCVCTIVPFTNACKLLFTAGQLQFCYLILK